MSGRLLLDSPRFGLSGRRGYRYLLRHTFSGASLTPSDLGPSLTAATGTPSVSGGVLGMAASNPITVFAAGLAANLVIQARVNFGNSAGADRRVEIQARASAADANTVSAVLYRSNNQILIWRRDAGTATTIATLNSAGLIDSTDYWVRFVLRGSSLEVLTSTDGATFTSRLTATESTYATNTGLALRANDNGTQTIIVDDLMVWTPPSEIPAITPSGPTYLLRHTFSGAALTPSDQGPSLTTVGGTAVVSGGVVAGGSAVALEFGYRTAALAVNATHEVRFNFGNSVGTSRNLYVRLRQHPSTDNGLWVRINRSSDYVRLDKIIDGATTQVAIQNSAGIADSTWYLVRIVASGQSVRVLLGTDAASLTERISATVSEHTTLGGVGLIMADNVASPTLQVDRYEVYTP